MFKTEIVQGIPLITVILSESCKMPHKMKLHLPFDSNFNGIGPNMFQMTFIPFNATADIAHAKSYSHK